MIKALTLLFLIYHEGRADIISHTVEMEKYIQTVTSPEIKLHRHVMTKEDRLNIDNRIGDVMRLLFSEKERN